MLTQNLALVAHYQSYPRSQKPKRRILIKRLKKKKSQGCEPDVVR